MKEIASGAKNGTNVHDDAQKDSFKGYSIEEIRYQRALMALRKEFCKSKVLRSVDNLRNPVSRKGDNSGSFLAGVGRVAGFAGSILTKMNVLDYAMVGMTLLGQGRKVYKLIKGKK